ncbi:hypothetical protein GCM10009626_07940 [Brachybacterium sacelli]
MPPSAKIAAYESKFMAEVMSFGGQSNTCPFGLNDVEAIQTIGSAGKRAHAINSAWMPILLGAALLWGRRSAAGAGPRSVVLWAWDI